jgi:sirohydrochlorin ferrochelatase
MATVVANISKGRQVEFYDRVLNNDPANSAFKMLFLATGGDSLGALQDYDTLAAMLAGPSAEVTNAGYSRKTITDADLFAWAPDDSANKVFLSFPSQNFTGISAGDDWDHCVIVYDNDTTGGTDANLIPVTISEARLSGLPISHSGGDTAVGFPNGWVQDV